MHKILVLNDTVISKNFGCQLVSHSLRKTLNKHYPDSHIDYVPYNVKSINVNDSYDVVIVNGEGSFGHHTNLPDGFRKLIEPCSYFFNKGIPVHLVNCSIQIPLDVLQKYIQFLAKFETIGLREPISYLYLQRNTNLQNIRLYPDLGAAYFEEESTIKDLDFCVGFGAISKEHANLQPQIKTYFKVLNNLKEEGYSMKYLGFPGNPFSDGALAKKFLTDIEVEEETFKEYYHSVKRAKINLTGRHHGSVMSFAGKTPFMSFNSNMWKTEGDQFLYGPFDYFRFEDLNEDQLTSYCMYAYREFNNQSFLLEERYQELKPLFEGHIISTIGEFTDVVERGIVDIDEIFKQIQELSYLNLDKYGLSEKV
jgi:hypothetical protein